MTEQQLNEAFQKAQNLDREAFGKIYDHFSDKLYRFIFFRVGHKELAEDILADTFVKAWTKITSVSSAKAFTSWLYQIAKNNVIDYYRVKKVTINLEEVVEVLEDAASPVDDANMMIEQKIVIELIEELPEDQRQIIRYKFFEDLENIEIAQIMGKSEGSVRVIQHRAINKLKDLLNKKKKH
ncbi:MAG: RNA polymerase sigma factor [Candidatus Doudnabacteria bacterium]|nr:RNA polymerase sigma factor [Candidatus Doudnabacteria bacterium]